MCDCSCRIREGRQGRFLASRCGLQLRDEIYIERRGRLERTDASFPSHDALLSAVHNVAQFVNREIDLDRPGGTGGGASPASAVTDQAGSCVRWRLIVC